MNLPFTIGPRGQRALRITGLVLLGLVCFVYGVHLTFPYDRVKDKGVEWLSSKYDVTVGGVERGWLPGNFTLTGVQLRTRPSKPGEVPKIIIIDRLDIDVHILPVIIAKVDVDLDAKVGPGEIDGSISVPLGKGDVIADMSSHGVVLSDVPGLASLIGMPMGGKGSVSAHLDLPGNDWSRADATLAIDCPNCTIGGEGAFFKPKNQNARNDQFVGQGVPVPEITIDRVTAQWSIKKGKLTTDKFEFQSPHIKVALDFTATVDKDITKSRIDSGCLRYRGTPALEKLDEKFYNALELTGGPLGPDDMRNLKLVGTLGNFRALGKVCGDNGPDQSQTPDLSGTTPPTPRAPSLSNLPGEGTLTPPRPTAPPSDAAPPPPDAPHGRIDDVNVPMPPPPEGAAAGAGGERQPGPQPPPEEGQGSGSASSSDTGAPRELQVAPIQQAPSGSQPPPPPDQQAGSDQGSGSGSSSATPPPSEQ